MPRRGPSRPNRRLLRQRLIVFVTVTALVALGIALAQGCQGPTRGLGSAPDRTVPSQLVQEPGAERHLAGG